MRKTVRSMVLVVILSTLTHFSFVRYEICTPHHHGICVSLLTHSRLLLASEFSHVLSTRRNVRTSYHSQDVCMRVAFHQCAFGYAESTSIHQYLHLYPHDSFELINVPDVPACRTLDHIEDICMA